MHVVTLQGADCGGAAMLHDPIRTAGRLRERDDCIQTCRSASIPLCLNPDPASSSPSCIQAPLSNVRHSSHWGGFQTAGSSMAGC